MPSAQLVEHPIATGVMVRYERPSGAELFGMVTARRQSASGWWYYGIRVDGKFLADLHQNHIEPFDWRDPVALEAWLAAP